jgi:cytochrome c-type biogenesis protein CcmF
MALAFTLGARSVYALLAFGFAAFACTTNIQEFVQGANARRRAHGESFGTALYRLTRANNRRYGGYIAHMGVVMIAVGITASSEFRTEREATLRPGESMTVGDFTVRFDRTWAKEEPQRVVVGTDLTILKGERQIGTMDPRMNFYRTTNDPVPTPSVRSRPGGDLYVNLMAFERDGSSATLSVIVEPLVGWIWLGGFVVAFGALLGLLKPRQRVARRVAAEESEPVAV